MSNLLRQRGVGILAAVLLPFAGMLLAGVAQAQFRPGGGYVPPPPPVFKPPPPPVFQPPPPPPFGNPGNPKPPGFGNGPLFEKVYTCSKCGKELGRGNVQPALQNCPFCGVNFINGTGPIFQPPPMNNVPPTVPPNMPPPVPPGNNIPVNNVPNQVAPHPAPNQPPVFPAVNTTGNDNSNSSTPYVVGGIAGIVLLGAIVLLVIRQIAC
jgi:hypothetical protein